MESIKKLSRTEQAKAIQKAAREGKELPKVKANIQPDVEIFEHEDHLVHFSFIHHNFDQTTAKEKGVWVNGQKCYPSQWKNLEDSLKGAATEIVLIHHPDKGVVTPKQGDKKPLTDKQQAQKDFAELFGYEAEENVTAAALKEQIAKMKEADAEFESIVGEGSKIERPVTLADALIQLEALKK